MIDNEYLDSKAWPFVEARELLKKRQKLLEKKGYAYFKLATDRVAYRI